METEIRNMSAEEREREGRTINDLSGKFIKKELKIIKEKKDIDYKDSKEEEKKQVEPYVNELPTYRQQYNNETK